MRLTSIGLTVSSKTAKNVAVRRKIDRFLPLVVVKIFSGYLNGKILTISLKLAKF